MNWSFFLINLRNIKNIKILFYSTCRNSNWTLTSKRSLDFDILKYIITDESPIKWSLFVQGIIITKIVEIGQLYHVKSLYLNITYINMFRRMYGIFSRVIELLRFLHCNLLVQNHLKSIGPVLKSKFTRKAIRYERTEP